MMERNGLRFVTQSGLNTSYTLTRALAVVVPNAAFARIARRFRLDVVAARVPTGTYASVSQPAGESDASELLSVVVPAFSEAAYLGAVVDALPTRRCVIPHEALVVSNSTDGTRDIARTFEGRLGLRILYEDRLCGKGAVSAASAVS